MIKLHLGCGNMLLKDWVNCDLYNPNAEVKCDAKEIPYEDETVDVIYNCHLIEHFDFFEAFVVLKEWYRVLKKGGVLVTETPDMFASCKKFIEASEEDRINVLYSHFFAKPWIDGEVHKFLYTEQQLRWTLEKSGFSNIIRQPATRYIGREDICLKLMAQK